MASEELKPYSHELKVHPGPYRDLELGIKTGEVRQCNDRDFQPGHLVVLREYAPDSGYTGRTMRRLITHVQLGYGLPNGLCVLSYAQDFDAMRQRAEKAELRAEQLRAIARDLRRHATCENMGHGRLDFHGLGDPCKVLERIDAALAKQP